jgi:hypothetical protein
MPHEFLDGAEVHAAHDEAAAEGVPEIVKAEVFDPGCLHRLGTIRRAQRSSRCPTEFGNTIAERSRGRGRPVRSARTWLVILTWRAWPCLLLGIVSTPALKSTSCHRSPRNSACLSTPVRNYGDVFSCRRTLWPAREFGEQPSEVAAREGPLKGLGRLGIAHLKPEEAIL